MHFQHSGDIWREFPALVPGVLYAEGIDREVDVGARADRFAAVLAAELGAVWPDRPVSAVLTPASPRFTFGA